MLSDKLKKLGVKAEMIETKQGAKAILTCMPDKSGRGLYILWKDMFSNRWRWALREWPDDDLGIPNHGAAPSVVAAVTRCRINDEKRAELRAAS